jgi:exonuclease VII large subunit
MIKNHREKLGATSRLLHQLSPGTILNRGFAMVTFNERIITDAALLQRGQQVKTIFKSSSFDSNVTEIKTHDPSDI